MRFTKDLKEDTLRKAIKSIYKEKAMELMTQLEKETAIALQTFYPKKVQDWIDAAPLQTCLSSQSKVEILEKESTGPKRHISLIPHLYDVLDEIIQRPYYKLTLKKPIKVLPADAYGAIELKVTPQSKVAKLARRITKLDEHAKVFRSKLKQAVDSCNTIKQFYDRYPEFVNYLPAVEKSNILAITEKSLIEASQGVEKI